MDTTTKNASKLGQTSHRSEMTRLLRMVSSGSDTAKNHLLALAFDELRQMASGLMRRERRDLAANRTGRRSRHEAAGHR